MKIELGKYLGEDVFWDIPSSPNSHVAIIGESGGGKTVIAQRLMCEIAESGGTVIAINSRGVLNDDQILPEFKNTFSLYRNDIDAFNEGIQVHLFDPIVYSDGYIENKIDTIGAIADIFSRAFKLGIKQRAALRGAIEAVMEDGSYVKYGISSIEDKLKDSRDKVSEVLAEQLHFLFAHNVFVDGDNFLVDGKINSINMSRLDVNTQSALTEVILSYLWRLANADAFKKNKIFIFLDECQNLDHSSNGPLALMISEGRRMGINLILGTQMILQGTTNSVQQRISQCGLLLFFKPASNRITLTARMISPDNVALWSPKLSTLRVGEFIAQGSLILRERRISYPLVVDGYVGERNPVEVIEPVKHIAKTVNGVPAVIRD